MTALRKRGGLLIKVKRGAVLVWFYLVLPLVEIPGREIISQGHLSSHFGITQPAGEELEIHPVQPSPVMGLLFLLTRQVTVKYLFEEFQTRVPFPAAEMPLTF